MLRKLHLVLAAALATCLLVLAAPAVAQSKIGFVNTERILRDSAPALRAQKKLEAEFAKRSQDVQKSEEQLRHMQESLDKNGMTMSDAQRREKEREFSDMSRDLQRRKREFSEDLNQRKNEELANVIDQANRVIRQIAEKENYDIIFQDAVYASPRIDITDKVIKALAASKPPAK
jgi:outer membrane protein